MCMVYPIFDSQGASNYFPSGTATSAMLPIVFQRRSLSEEISNQKVANDRVTMDVNFNFFPHLAK